jgi:nitroimidazol reductase NimA-like FMN-containing flavoprotein (pyridoxamine 5'-phosphate oxidase superfamily)
MRIRSLDRVECENLLAGSRIGHLACAKDGQPYVTTLHFAHAGQQLYAFSLPGKKIEWMRANPRVSVLFEERKHARSWRSVIVDGTFEELPDRIGHKVQRDRAWSLLSREANWWQPGALKPDTMAAPRAGEHVFFCIHIEEISGREALAGPD